MAMEMEVIVVIRDKVLTESGESIRETQVHLKDCFIKESREVTRVYGPDGSTLRLDPASITRFELSGIINNSPKEPIEPDQTT